jgi:hypothetical protein
MAETKRGNVRVVTVQQTDVRHAPRAGSFDEMYLGDGHGGNPISWQTNVFTKFERRLDVGLPTVSVPLIVCCGIGIIGKLCLGFSKPLESAGTLRFFKKSFAKSDKDEKDSHGHVEIALDVGMKEVDLMGHRSLFVVYKDCRVAPLVITLELVKPEAWTDLVATLLCEDAGLDPADAPENPMVAMLNSLLGILKPTSKPNPESKAAT